MKMQDIGEKNFLKELLPVFTQSSDFINGFGHDASIIDIGLENLAIAMKIDRAGKPVASINGWSDYRLWGRLAVTANCSDILAVGGTPKGFMLAVSVPKSWDVKDVKDIILGAEEECEANNISFLGGDTKESDEAQVVGSAIGIVDKEYHLDRKVSKEGDYLVLAGSLGGFTGAYSFMKNDFTDMNKEKYLSYITHPKARWNEAEKINKLHLANGGMDLSDGLFDALKTIIHPSCGAVIDLEKIPYHSFAQDASKEYSMPIFNLSFGVGDWAMLYSIQEKNINSLKEVAIKYNLDFHTIGRVISKKGIYGVNDKEETFKINGIVNENFKSRMEDQGSYFEAIKNQVTLKKYQKLTTNSGFNIYKMEV